MNVSISNINEDRNYYYYVTDDLLIKGVSRIFMNAEWPRCAKLFSSRLFS